MGEADKPTAVLLMAYGTPNSLDEIEPYYTDIRGGRRPSPENLRELTERYRSIGGRTPLLDITRAQAAALQTRLGEGYRVYIGMKHWHPYIAQAVNEIACDGMRQMIAVALAPHYSRFSIDGYIQRVDEAVAKSGSNIKVSYVKSWNDNPFFLQSIAERMQAARQEFGVSDWQDVAVIFSAHSLPERILQSNDPYPQELRETCEGVAARLGLAHWRFAFQSAGRTGEKWLGPELLEEMGRVKAEGYARVLIAPIGFVADHLEVLYDIDVEAARRARELGIEMRRIESPNATPRLIEALEDVVKAQRPHLMNN